MTYVPAGTTPKFGDILSADWFHSAYVRKDARPLEIGAQLGGGRPTWVEAAPAPDRDLLLAHGRPVPVILLSDPCEIESVLTKRGGNRLLVAGIQPWNADAEQWLAQGRQRDFRRHLLAPADGYAGGVVQFAMLFHVAPVCITAAERDWSLERAPQVNLEAAWEAYAVRRGPRAVADNARKLATLLTAAGDEVIAADIASGTADVAEAASATRALVEETLGVAWDLEGGLLNDVSDVLELGIKGQFAEGELWTRTTACQNALREAFVRLSELATRTAAALNDQQGAAAAVPAGA